MKEEILTEIEMKVEQKMQVKYIAYQAKNKIA